ncbi:hypothetical protein J3R30DRAFT_892454 [Lentinula aciculospora]|uniref:DH domain-containing protein n=1 Tax=Lentinula aciculospora TaxID=153920 RepID=A0A9W9AQT8_9AGAR|nr:hypothetical protein J3R30DRAFT_892454 [Lentinula aciculospora]
MKAFFSRLHLGSGSGGGGTVKDSNNGKDLREKEIGKLPPLRAWPPEAPSQTQTRAISQTQMQTPPPIQPQTQTQTVQRAAHTERAQRAERTQSQSSQYAVFKPLPEVDSEDTGDSGDTEAEAEAELDTEGVYRDRRGNGTPRQTTPPSRTSNSTPSTRSSSTPTPTPSATPTPSEPPIGQSQTYTPHTPSRKHTTGSLNSDVQKKVAFLSPPRVQSPIGVLDTVEENGNGNALPLKTNVTRFQAMQGEIGRPSTAASGNSSSSPAPHNQSQQSLRSGTPYSQMSGVSGISQFSSTTGLSGTTTSASGSRILSAASWSEVTEEDLVLNLGSRERTRQEVLFEIISSEERYVGELAKMKEMFVEPLLHPYSPKGVVEPPESVLQAQTQSARGMSLESLPPIAARFMSPTPSSHSNNNNNNNSNRESDSEDDEDAKDTWKEQQIQMQNHPRSPYSKNNNSKKKPSTIIPFPSGARSHQSLPPIPRTNPNAVSTQSLGRQSVVVERERAHSQTTNANNGTLARGMFKKVGTTNTVKEVGLDDNYPLDSLPLVPPHLLPPDLRICLEVIDSGVFEGHKRLSEALRKRYDDQYPLVRSLADVFVANSDIFQGYATYVLHLERALEQVDNAINDISPPKSSTASITKTIFSSPTFSSTSRTSSNSSETSRALSQIPHLLRTLDTLSSYSGQTSLSISLSKPFQRLLKYPLLFQNLLYHTDPSTTEYESTLQLVAEIEVMVRGIEDEKVEWEDREKTRDVLGRIEWGDGNNNSNTSNNRSTNGKGKVKDKGWVGRPKMGRVLIDEKVYTIPATSTTSTTTTPPVNPIQPKKSKSSFRRLSDALTPTTTTTTTSSSHLGNKKPFSKKDLWLVVFNDVVLLCQRTGVTTMPIWRGGMGMEGNGGGKDLGGKGGKEVLGPGRKQLRVKPRNLYKFLKVCVCFVFLRFY